MDRIKTLAHTHRTFFIPFIVLCLGTFITLISYHQVKIQTDAYAKREFQSDIDQLTDDMLDRIETYAETLRGAQGLFVASDLVTRDEWRQYVKTINVQEKYADIMEFGYIQSVSKTQLPAYLKKARSEGFPQYTVYPEGIRDQYYPVTYLEPLNNRTSQVFGYDMFTDPTQKASMERARDTGKISLSEIASSNLEPQTQIQSRLVLYLPVYKSTPVLNSRKDRQNNLIGFIFSSFHIDDFVKDIIAESKAPLAFKIYDNATISRETLLYDSLAGEKPPSGRDTTIKTIALYGRMWTIQFYALTQYQLSEHEELLPTIILFGGFIMSLITSVLVYSFASSHETARRMAYSMTSHLDRTRNELLNLIEHLTYGVALLDEHQRIKHANRRFIQLHGLELPESDYMGRLYEQILDQARNHYAHYDELLQSTVSLFSNQKKSLNETVPLREGKSLERDFIPVYVEGVFHGSILIYRDVSENVRHSEELQNTNEELERVNRAMVGRELKMVELKTQLAKLQESKESS